jgi:hypothetical protein
VIPVFDGHNDTITSDDVAAFASGRDGGHIDLPRAWQGRRHAARHDRRARAQVAERIGVEHVALGSDLDGATIPAELGDVAGLPRLLDALRAGGFDALRAGGFGDGEVRAIAYDNWRRVLGRAWAG